MPLGILLVDMFYHNLLSYEYGTVKNGLDTLEAFLEAAALPVYGTQEFFHDFPVKASVQKTSQDAFKGTSLAQMLRDDGLTDLIVAGYDKRYCVRATAVGGLEAGFGIVACPRLMFVRKEGLLQQALSPITREFSDEFFRKNTVYCPTIGSLIGYISNNLK